MLGRLQTHHLLQVLFLGVSEEDNNNTNKNNNNNYYYCNNEHLYTFMAYTNCSKSFTILNLCF